MERQMRRFSKWFLDMNLCVKRNKKKKNIEKEKNKIRFFGDENRTFVVSIAAQATIQLHQLHGENVKNIHVYNIARALVLSKSCWAIMNKIFMYARPCSIKWRVQFHFSCKISVAFSASSFCLSFGNVKIILNNPNPTSSLWLLPGKDVYFNVSILTLFVSIFIEYFYFVWLRCFCERKS